MAWMTGGEALVESICREGVRVIFGLPGLQLYGVMAALRDQPGIRFIPTRHEQATTYMADGYARASGTFGTALVVPGQGILNAAAGLSTAYAASSPVLMICGQVPKEHIGKKIGVLHEIDDQLQAISSITKWRKTVSEISDIPAAVQETVYQLRTGRPRPVAIELPPETLEGEAEVELLPPIYPVRPSAASADVDRAAEILLASTRPVIYAGGGVHASDAHDALARVAECLDAGVVQSGEGKGAVSDRSDLSLGSAMWAMNPLRKHVDSADVILVVGSRLALMSLDPEQQVIQIDVDGDEIGRNHKKTLGLVGDARATLESLLERLGTASPPRASRKTEREILRAEIAAMANLEPQASIVKSIRTCAPEDTILVADLTQVGYYCGAFWPVYQPRTYLTPSYSGSLGFAYPTALGAKVARPEHPVVSLSGDGGFFFNVQELATAVQNGINVVAVVFNDNSYGNVSRDMEQYWGGSFGSNLFNPDLMKLAAAYGIVGMRADKPTDAGALVREGLQKDCSVLIEVPVSSMPRPPFFKKRSSRRKYQRPLTG